MHIYEYLFTAIIIMTMLIASSSMIGIFSEPIQNVSEKEQLKVAVQKIMLQILSDPGEPVDWGWNTTAENSLKTFGLAKHSETTRDVYVLDRDKVLRLDDTLLLSNNTSWLYISRSRLTSLLNLGADYGLAVEFIPALDMKVEKLSTLDRYEVSISSEYGGFPIVGADVTARMYYCDASGTLFSTDSQIEETDYNGKITFDFGLLPSETKILILVVEYYGAKVVRVFPSGANLSRAFIFGDTIFLDEPRNLHSEAYEIIVTKKDGGYAIETINATLTDVGDGKYSLAYYEPSTVSVIASPENGGDLVFTSAEASLRYSTISGSYSFPFAYSVERTVVIDGSFYIMRLYLWRMSW